MKANLQEIIQAYFNNIYFIADKKINNNSFFILLFFYLKKDNIILISKLGMKPKNA